MRFGRWTVVGPGPRRSGPLHWECRCDCGTQRLVQGGNLRGGRTLSCGCYNSDVVTARNTTHGMADRAEYVIWAHMNDRCSNPNTERYRAYGGRGIKVCARWQNSFENFYADMGPRPSARHQIDRIDNDGDYEPGNVRWRTPLENCNNKSNNRVLTLSGKSQTASEWARELGVRPHQILARIDKLGWTVEKALTTPIAEVAPEVVLTFAGRSQPLRAWAAETGLKAHTIRVRLERGWSVEDALTKPLGPSRWGKAA